jgi:hypothetical protein
VGDEAFVVGNVFVGPSVVVAFGKEVVSSVSHLGYLFLDDL